MKQLLSPVLLSLFGFFLGAVHGTHYRMYGYPPARNYNMRPIVYGSTVLPLSRPMLLNSPPYTTNVRYKPEPKTLQVTQPTGIDACSMGRHDCEHICVSKKDSYFCKCRDGYTLNPDKKTCSRIDICALGRHGCEHICVSSDGSYTCKCRNGYTLNPDKKTCSQEVRRVVQVEDPCKCEALVAFQRKVNTHIESLTSRLEQLTRKLQTYERRQ